VAPSAPCFLDTSALYALFDRGQDEHAVVAGAWEALVRSDAPLVTTDYVVLELVALLQRRLGVDAVAAFTDHVLPFVEVAWVTPDTHGTAVSILRTSRRRDVSLVDCCSFAVMRDAGLVRAFALDAHFAEQGFACIPA
jgi:uncharacterized protein